MLANETEWLSPVLIPFFFLVEALDSAHSRAFVSVSIRELGAGAPEPGFFRGAGALCEIQVELEPVV